MYYVDLEPCRVGCELRYLFSEDFALTTHLHPLASLARSVSDDCVLGVFQFEIHGTPSASGLVVEAVRGQRILAPLPRRRRAAAKEQTLDSAADEDEQDDEEADSAEDPSGDEASDLSRSSGVVDTDVESVVGSSGDSADSESLVDAARSPEAAPVVRIERPPLWDNPYFYIVNNTGIDESVKICMHSCWSHEPPGGMGSKQRSKTLTPRHYGETRDDSTRSMLLLRAWMLWRARWNGWSSGDVGRMRQFQEDAAILEHDVRRLQPTVGGLLGDARADDLFRSWVPDVVAKLAL